MTTQTSSGAKTRLAPIAGLLILSLLWSIGTLRHDLLPDLISHPLPRLAHQAVPLAMAALAFAAIALHQNTKLPHGRWLMPSNLHSVLVGIGLFVLPALLSKPSEGSIPPVTRAALLALVPVFAVVFYPYFSDTIADQSTSRLLAALLSLIGTLAVFPLDIPTSIEPAWFFCLLIVAAASLAAANCFAVSLSIAQPRSHSLSAAIATGSAAIVLAIASALTERPFAVPLSSRQLLPDLALSTAVELPALLLLFWLMPRMAAPRMATRYIFSLLASVLVGAALLRAPLRPRTCLGLLLMTAGAGYLLLARERQSEATGLSLH